MCFQLVPKSVTLDDLKRPFHTVFQNMCIFGAHHKNLNEPCYWWQRCCTMTVVSGNIRFMQIFAVFLGDEASNDSGVIENVNFQGFQTLCLRHLTK